MKLFKLESRIVLPSESITKAIVLAENQQEARQFVGKVSFANGEDSWPAWNDPKKTKCSEVDMSESGILLAT